MKKIKKLTRRLSTRVTEHNYKKALSDRKVLSKKMKAPLSLADWMRNKLGLD